MRLLVLMSQLFADLLEIDVLYNGEAFLILMRLLGMVILLAVTSNTMGAPRWEDLSPVKPASTSAYDEGVYSDCILKNTKVAGLSPRVLAQIMDACEIKATPKLCRGYVKKPWEEYGGTNECITKCRTAGWWSRKYGECSTD